ncbi:helix-turn-helix domain-containing protein [Methylophilus flavus]|uniref:Helix-turn-helix domain-containing protein n=1 Tax=Methylophilus flavus TaxID=640084 RepID=A0ABW3P8Z8_9PROT
MDINKAFGNALKKSRKEKKKTQEDFGIVSSRTYISSLERGLQSVTIEKLEEIAAVIGVHPMILLYRSYCIKDGFKSGEKIIEILKNELLLEKATALKE